MWQLVVTARLKSTQTRLCTGRGCYGYRAKGRIENMEFIQFIQRLYEGSGQSYQLRKRGEAMAEPSKMKGEAFETMIRERFAPRDGDGYRQWMKIRVQRMYTLMCDVYG